MPEQSGKRSSNSGASQPNFGVQVAAGLIPGWSSVQKFGRNPDIDNTTADIWTQGGYYPYLTAASTLHVTSTSANDDVGSSGVTSIRIQGLNDSFEEIQEDINMDGTSDVTTTNSYRRVYRAFALTAGTAGSSVGNTGGITGRATSDTTLVQFLIAAGANQTQLSQYTVPKGKTGYLTSWFITTDVGGNAIVECELRIRNNNDSGVFRLVQHSGMTGNNGWFFSDMKDAPIVVTEKSDIKIVATSDVVNTDVHGGYSLLLGPA